MKDKNSRVFTNPGILRKMINNLVIGLNVQKSKKRRIKRGLT